MEEVYSVDRELLKPTGIGIEIMRIDTGRNDGGVSLIVIA